MLVQLKDSPITIDGGYQEISTDAYYLVGFYEKLETAFNKQAENHNYDSITMQVEEGLSLKWGEVGLEKLELLSTKYKTLRGVQIGSTREAVQQAYGRLGMDAADIWYTFRGSVEYSEGFTYAFYFEHDLVSKIVYGWPNR